eukprot:gb/GECG01002944.1/.p1 GENE.gb/GECG01002944.1/~~gb/GECG01002944.1/.p1  ORF type:complete len:357 (+),score=48.85 gb/GECG01002944.1/:1-1071(+)
MAAPSTSAFSSSRVAAMYARRQLAKDQVLRCYTDNIRLSLVRCPLTVQKGIDRFNVKNREAAGLYARGLTASSLMSSMLKGEERISLEFTPQQNDNDMPYPVSQIMTESLHIGEMRGFIHGNQVEQSERLPGFNGTLKTAVKTSGYLKVRKILYNHAKPITSITPLQQGDVISDLREYFRQSEQIPSCLHVEEAIEGDPLSVKYSGGILAQLLPGGEQSELEEIQNRLRTLSMRTCHEDGMQLWDIAKDLSSGLADKDVTDSAVFTKIPLDFFCRCSKSRFLTHLASFGTEELNNMQAEQPTANLTCQFCNEAYDVGPEDYDVAKKVATGEISATELQEAEAKARLRTLNEQNGGS